MKKRRTEAPFRVGLDIGGTTIKYGLAGRSGLVEYGEIPFQYYGDGEGLVRALAAIVRRFQENYNVVFAGAGCPGRVKDSVVWNAANLGIDRLDLGRELEKQLELPVLVENDATAAMLGEVCSGGLKGCDNGILITLGTGVGGGILIHGRPYAGERGCAGEFGHVVLVRDGRLCGCGQKGCFEAYASGRALIAQALEGGGYGDSLLAEMEVKQGRGLDGVMFFEGVRQKDAYAASVLEQYVAYLALGCKTFTDILDCGRICIGGGISQAGELLFGPLKRACERIGIEAGVQPALLGNRAGITGAANLEQFQKTV